MMDKAEPQESVLARLQKPIRYALRADLSGMMKIRGLSDFVQGQIGEVLTRRWAGETRAAWTALRDLFSDYDRLSPILRRERLLEAQSLLERLAGDSTALSPVGNPRQDPVGADRRETIEWERPVQYLKGVGPKRAERLLRLGIRNLEDLLYFVPWRYEDRRRLSPIGEIKIGEERTLCGVVQSTYLRVTPRRGFKIFEMIVGDETGSVMAKWFNQPYLQKVFRKGQRLMLTGTVRMHGARGFGPALENPVYEILPDEGDSEGLHTGRVVPVYHETPGWTSRMLRSTIKDLLDRYRDFIPEFLPPTVRESHRLPPLSEALSAIHFPPPDASIDLLNEGRSEAHRRLVFDELYLLQLGLGLKRREAAEESRGTAFRTDGSYFSRFLEGLPFSLTSDQKSVLEEIRRDMARPHPMNRLLQGDVGCGKTIVALAAMMIAADNGYQSALMAPTEILAEQHFLTVKKWINLYGLDCRLLTSGRKKRETRKALEMIGSKKPCVIIGTHSLIQQDVRFGRLGLVVVDEQHRFGVMQRAGLRKKGYHPDVLIMTATPIPRTLALTLHGDLDLSVIRELPKGRAPTQTILYSQTDRPKAYSVIRDQIAKGRQTYIVYPLVESSEKVDLKAAVEMAAHLEKSVFPSHRIGLLHGRMPTDEKERIMDDFKAGRIQILVTTSVIEVGIDVPNATVMLIEHAERFGLSQLHQLRGRVGRGPHAACCLLMAAPPVSEEARRRLETMVRTRDGFVIAEADLAIRGPGEFFGTRQSGLPELKVANLLRDGRILESARREAGRTLKEDPGLSRADHARLKGALSRKWSGKLELFTVS